MAPPLTTTIAAPVRKIAYHIDTGPFEFPYALDATSAVNRHPDEWRWNAWSPEDVTATRARRKEQHDAETNYAKSAGTAPPPPLPNAPPPMVLTPEEQAALDDFRAKQAEARKLLEDTAKEEADAQAKADAVAAAKALLEQQPPMPDPSAPRRPFGRKGDPTPAERAQLEKAAAKRAQDQADKDAKAAAQKDQTDAAQQARDKAEADRKAAATQQT